MDSGARGANGPVAAPPAPERLPPNQVVGPLRAAPSHSVRRSGMRWRTVAAVVGSTAAVIAAVIAVVMLGRPPSVDKPDSPASDRLMAQHITVSQLPQTSLPLSDPQIAGLLTRRPDLGPLADSRRRESCLRGLGYPPSADVLGARSLEIRGRPAVLLLLPGDTPKALAAFVVDPDCNAAGTGLIAQTSVSRP